MLERIVAKINSKGIIYIEVPSERTLEFPSTKEGWPGKIGIRMNEILEHLKIKFQRFAKKRFSGQIVMMLT